MAFLEAYVCALRSRDCRNGSAEGRDSPFGLRLIAAIMSNRAMEFSDTPQGEASGPSLRRSVAEKSSLPRSVVSL